MANDNIKQELDLIHFALSDLQELSGIDGVKAIQLDAFLKLIFDRYETLHSDVIAMMKRYEDYEKEKLG